MALDAGVLGALIVTQIEAATENQLPPIAATVWKAVAQAIIDHITTAGVVTVTVPSVSGVTPGPGVSGSGVGTGIIT